MLVNKIRRGEYFSHHLGVYIHLGDGRCWDINNHCILVISNDATDVTPISPKGNNLPSISRVKRMMKPYVWKPCGIAFGDCLGFCQPIMMYGVVMDNDTMPCNDNVTIQWNDIIYQSHKRYFTLRSPKWQVDCALDGSKGVRIVRGKVADFMDDFVLAVLL